VVSLEGFPIQKSRTVPLLSIKTIAGIAFKWSSFRSSPKIVSTLSWLGC
jgi:hypothetical protein